MTVKVTNVGTSELHVFLVSEALTAEGNACLSGQAGPFSIVPTATLVAIFPMLSKCAAPFTTASLQISMQDPDTKARPYHASYSGAYRVIP